MPKITTKIAAPIFLAGVFIMAVFWAFNIGFTELRLDSYILLLFLVAFVFFFGLSIGQNLSSPIKKLLDNATELSRGNLSGRVYLETKDELSELANAFNKIAEELQASHEQGANAEKSIDIKVKAKTQELEETICALDQKIKNRTIELERLMEESKRTQSYAKAKEEEILNLKKELASKQKINKPSRKTKDNTNI